FAIYSSVLASTDIHPLFLHAALPIFFRGEDAYISPNFYPSKQEHHRHVPTWNYQVVHMYGAITFQHDERTKRAAVGLLTKNQERSEEHTSELQSRENLVCRLLLEKKR